MKMKKMDMNYLNKEEIIFLLLVNDAIIIDLIVNYSNSAKFDIWHYYFLVDIIIIKITNKIEMIELKIMVNDMNMELGNVIFI